MHSVSPCMQVLYSKGDSHPTRSANQLQFPVTRLTQSAVPASRQLPVRDPRGRCVCVYVCMCECVSSDRQGTRKCRAQKQDRSGEQAGRQAKIDSHGSNMFVVGMFVWDMRMAATCRRMGYIHTACKQLAHGVLALHVLCAWQYPVAAARCFLHVRSSHVVCCMFICLAGPCSCVRGVRMVCNCACCAVSCCRPGQVPCHRRADTGCYLINALSLVPSCAPLPLARVRSSMVEKWRVRAGPMRCFGSLFSCSSHVVLLSGLVQA